MAISPHLQQFRSSGIYRLEFDKSQTTNINSSTLRLMVGYSKKGPFNTPVLISNTEDFVNIYGGVDKSLEKDGIFFHRSCLAALSRGPILCLSSRTFATCADCSDASTTGDRANFVNVNTNAEGAISSVLQPTDWESYTDFFDIDKFMIPSDTNTLAAGAAIGFSNLMTLVNLKSENISVIVRKAKDTDGFDITAGDWYGTGNVPEYLKDRDYVSDFLVDVFVFKGKFNSNALDADPVYGDYFTSTGLTVNKFDEFANLRNVTLIAKYSGSMLPGFKDMNGVNMFIESIINAETRRTGLFCAIDEDKITDVTGTKLDLVGHGQLAYQNNMPVLSHIFAAGDDRAITIGDGLDAGAYTVTKSFTAAINTNILTISYASVHYAGTDGTVKPLIPNFNLGLSVGDYVMTNNNDGFERYARVLSVSWDTTHVSGTYWNDTFTVTLSENFVAAVTAQSGTDFLTSLDSAASEYHMFNLDAAVLGDVSIDDSINAIKAGTSLGNTILDKDAIDFRYIVDTFGSYDTTNGINNKSVISDLAQERQSASAILNAPTISDFKKSFNPSFTDSGVFNAQYVKDGGNLSLKPTSLYTLPSITDGSNYAFYYAPGLLVKDAGKNVVVPPAAYVSNNYIDKYTAALPWSIIAGPRRGVVSGPGVIGAEYAFDKDDRDILEPFGINPIVFQRGAGLTILGNKTGQQNIKSALSSAHVREVLIYIQNGVADILKEYVFEFNTVQTRLEIKTLVDSFLDSVKQDGGVYDFKNVMDTTNNTNEIIDNNIGIVDTYVEPVKGLEIVVHRTTVLNTGEIATGNFS